MDDNQNKQRYLVIGIVFLVVCAVIIYYATKDNTKTENFLMGDVPEITEKITQNAMTSLSTSSCQTMINILTRDMYKAIMGTPSTVNYQCTPESTRDSFLSTLYYILQVPTLQILNNATSIDNIDKTNFINLWLTANIGLNNPSVQITINKSPNFAGISSVTIEEDNVFLSALDLGNRLNRSTGTSFPRIPSDISPVSDYGKSLSSISSRAAYLLHPLEQPPITIADLKDDNSNITTDDMTKYLLLLLVGVGTFFTK